MIKWFKCKECRVQFEHDPEISEKPEECPDCSSHAIVPVKVNDGFIEHGSDEKYELGLEEGDTRQEDDEDDEPGSIFDKRELDDEDEDDED